MSRRAEKALSAGHADLLGKRRAKKLKAKRKRKQRYLSAKNKLPMERGTPNVEWINER